jgi:hypothetical protein
MRSSTRGGRKSWLTDGTMSPRTSQPGRTARFDWENASTRLADLTTFLES